MAAKTYKTKLPEITLKYKKGDYYNVKICSSNDTYDVFQKVFDSDTMEINESFCVLFLNRANNTIGWTKHSSGGAVSCVVDVKLIMVAALQCGAQNIIIAHNHPSGNTQPSQSDIGITKKVKTACETLDINLLDHIIITDADGFYSFADEGML